MSRNLAADAHPGKPLAGAAPAYPRAPDKHDTRCQLKDDKDYTKLTSDALTNAYDAYKAVKQKHWRDSDFVVKVFNAFVAFESLSNGGDEFVGVSAGLGDITSHPADLPAAGPESADRGWGGAGADDGLRPVSGDGPA